MPPFKTVTKTGAMESGAKSCRVGQGRSRCKAKCGFVCEDAKPYSVVPHLPEAFHGNREGIMFSNIRNVPFVSLTDKVDVTIGLPSLLRERFIG